MEPPTPMEFLLLIRINIGIRNTFQTETPITTQQRTKEIYFHLMAPTKITINMSALPVATVTTIPGIIATPTSIPPKREIKPILLMMKGKILTIK